MIKLILALFCVIFSFSIGYSQIDLSTTGSGDLRVNRSISPMKEKQVLKSESSPNLYDDFKEGIIYLNDSSVVHGKILFDFYEDIISFRGSNKNLTLTPELVRGFTIQNDKNEVIHVFETFAHVEMKNRTGFLEVMNEGDFRILVERIFLVKSGDYNPAIQAGEGDKLILKYNYYVDNDHEIVGVNSKNDILNQFEGQKFYQELKDFVKENKLKFRLPDLVKIAKFINEEK